MPFVLCYTKEGSDKYRDLNDAMHLALSLDGKKYEPLRNNTGVLFPEADLTENGMPGQTKTLLYPWLFRFEDGKAGVIAVRRNNQNKADTKNIGCAMIFKSSDFVCYELIGYLPLENSEVKNTRCRYEKASGKYRVEWDTDTETFGGYTSDFKTIADKAACKSSFEAASAFGIAGAVPGNILEVTEKEAEQINIMLGLVYNTGIKPMELKLRAGDSLDAAKLPKVTCLYSDGSTHDKAVDWDTAALAAIDTSKPGEYTLNGKVKNKVYPYPFVTPASDPCVFNYFGKYFFTSSNSKVTLRISDTIDGLQFAEPLVVYEKENSRFWAQELHVIKGVPYIFTSDCRDNNWQTVQSVILRCKGDPANPADWEEPRFVVKPNGEMLNKATGVCLDMTYFTFDDVHYVSWSNRDIDRSGDGSNEYGSNGPADIYIAAVDPDEPWQLLTDPVCIMRPIYGWDRIETEVEEGPYILRRGDDLFITTSGSSVGVLYVVGLLKAKYGSDLLDPKSWTEVPYPILTSESIPGQYGPGHNNFVKDPESGDDLIVLHARPLPEGRDQNNPRHSTLRRVHWGASGYPNLEMTPERELDPKFADVSLNISIV